MVFAKPSNGDFFINNWMVQGQLLQVTTPNVFLKLLKSLSVVGGDGGGWVVVQPSYHVSPTWDWIGLNWVGSWVVTTWIIS